MKKNIAFWVNATRPFALPASAIPVVVAAAYLFYTQSQAELSVQWFLLPIVLLAAMLYHSGSNMISDFDDAKYGIDHDDSLGYHSPLLKKEVDGPTWKRVALSILAVGTLLGLFLCIFAGPQLLWIGLAGLLGGYFYRIFKYRALGDLLIFVLFGLLMMLGAGYALTSLLLPRLLFLAIPIGAITVGILHANNTRDIQMDTASGMRSQASVLGFRGAQYEYYFLIAVAYLSVPLMYLFGILPLSSLLIFLTLPMGLQNCRRMALAKTDELTPILSLDEATAKLQLAFGACLSLGLVMDTFLPH